MLNLTGNAQGMQSLNQMSAEEEEELRARFDDVVTGLFERMDKTGD